MSIYDTAETIAEALSDIDGLIVKPYLSQQNIQRAPQSPAEGWLALEQVQTPVTMAGRYLDVRWVLIVVLRSFNTGVTRQIEQTTSNLSGAIASKLRELVHEPDRIEGLILDPESIFINRTGPQETELTVAISARVEG